MKSIKQKINIVVIGGGGGSPTSIIALKQNFSAYNLSAIVPMSDSGGSSGLLRREFNTLPPGDIMRVILAMSKHEYLLLKQIFHRIRFSETGKLTGHDLGNIFLVLGAQYTGDYLKSIKALSQSVETIGEVQPVSLQLTNLFAKLTNGKIIKGEHKIDKPNYSRKFKIEKVWLEPAVKAYPQALRKLMEADYIIFSHGSLYTSIIATLLPKGVFEAIKKSSAKLVNITQNSFEDSGETGPECLSERIKALEQYLPRPLDIVIYNNKILDDKQKKFYQEKGWTVLKKDAENLPNRKLIGADFEQARGGMCAIKLGKILKKVLK